MLSIWSWFCRHAENKSCKIVEASTKISEHSLGDQAVCGRVRIPIDSPWEVLRVKPKLQWGPQEVRGARNMQCLPRKATGNKQRTLRESSCGLQLPKPWQQGCTSPLEFMSCHWVLQMPDMKLQIGRFYDHIPEFLSYFVFIRPSYGPIHVFWNRDVYPVIVPLLYVRNM